MPTNPLSWTERGADDGNGLTFYYAAALPVSEGARGERVKAFLLVLLQQCNPSEFYQGERGECQKKSDREEVSLGEMK